MLSNKPYLIRAFYEWIVDNDCTPFLVVNATFPRCNVPEEYVENGEVTLNISPIAIRELKLGNDLIEFRASFSGIVHLISVPVKAVLAVYAEENEQGMFFDYEEETAEDWPEVPASASSTNKVTSITQKKSHLKLVE